MISANVLVTSVSQKVPLVMALKKAILKKKNEGKVIGGDTNPDCIAKYFTEGFWQMPLLKDLTIEELINFCTKHNITSIVPTRDGELLYFAENKKRLEIAGISVMISEPQTIECCIDKLLFFKKLNEWKFPVILTDTSIENLKADKFVVKERYGAGAKNIGLNLLREEALKIAGKLKEPVFQPYVEGKEVSVDVYVDKRAKAKGAVVRSRDLIVDGESQITTVVENRKLENICMHFAEKAGVYGHAVIQVMIDSTNNFHIVECNSRFGGASTLSLEYGLDSFYWFLMESTGTDISSFPFIKQERALKQVRYKADLIV